MPIDRLLLRDGIVIAVEPSPHARPADVLVEHGRILAVGPGLPAVGATVIDASGQLVVPGFVDTHRHLWQTVLRGIATDVDLAGYMSLVQRRLARRVRPEDVYAGTLAGALECLDSGITTVQDFSDIQQTPEHSDAAVSALRASGIRAVFGYGYPVVGPAHGQPATRRPAEVRRVRAEYFTDDAQLLRMALAPRGPSYAPLETAVADWRLARELDLRITVHVGSSPFAERPVQALRDHGLLSAATTYVHGNSLPDDELALIAESAAAVSIAPAVEAQMGHGAPMINRLRRAGVTTGLGADVVTSTAGDMFSLMRAALLTSRVGQEQRSTTASVLRLATLEGAAAIGLGGQIGSLQAGMQADIALLRADAINLCGALHDPVGALVTAAHPGNVDTVLVAGVIVKRDGQLASPLADGAAAAVRRSAEYLLSSLA
jgi:5-methylthioadenosine/S-adenosylhomocysteine deaminase